MEKKLNIAAILRDKPEGMKLWSPAYGECFFSCIDTTLNTVRIKHMKTYHYLNKEGKLYSSGSCVLFPSRQMRDWSKFAWKKGDVLVCKSVSPHIYTLFDHFTNDDYTEFYGRFHYLHEYRENSGNTSGKTTIFEKISDEKATRVISSMERHFGGKLNLETLEIEKPQFKDGDIVVVESNDKYAKTIFILAYGYGD